MANWTILKEAIANVIKTNGNQEITGQVLQNTLTNIVNAIGENAAFVDVATPSTNPGTPDGPVFYLAGEGTYPNFSNLTIETGQLGVLKWNGSWSKQVLETKTSSIGYVTCDTIAGTTAKVVTVTGLTALSIGTRLLVKMTNNNTASNATLNINSLGAKPLYYNNTRVSGDNAWKAGEVIDLYYDGTNFYSSNFQGGNGEGGNLILEWNTDVATTRNQISLSERKSGVQITYLNPDLGWINEQYIGDKTTNSDELFGSDSSWNTHILDCLNKKYLAPLLYGRPWSGFINTNYIKLPISAFNNNKVFYIYKDNRTPHKQVSGIKEDGSRVDIPIKNYNVYGDSTLVFSRCKIPNDIKYIVIVCNKEAYDAIQIVCDIDITQPYWIVEKKELPTMPRALFDKGMLNVMIDKYFPGYGSINKQQINGYVRSSKNLIDLSYVVFTGVGGATPYYPLYTTDFIPVEQNTEYAFSFSGLVTDNMATYEIDFYDSSKTYISNSLYASHTTPENAAFVKIVLSNYYSGLGTLRGLNKIQYEKGKESSYEPPYIPMLPANGWEKKTIAFLGDSITQAGKYITPVKNILNVNTINLGRDGCQWTDTINSGSSTNNNIKESIDALVSNGIIPDCIIIALGTNDLGNNKPIGSMDETASYSDNNENILARNTIYNAVRYGITRLRNLYPKAKLLIATPIQRHNTSYSKQIEYGEAIKNAAKMMSVDCIDTFTCGIFANADNYLDWLQDGLHETALGGKIHGTWLANELRKYIEYENQSVKNEQ